MNSCFETLSSQETRHANSHIDLVLKVFVREAKFARVNLSIHLDFWLLVVWTDSLLKEKVLEKLVH